MLVHWIAQYGYWAVLVGMFFEGETIVVLAGYAVHRGYLSAPVVSANLSQFLTPLCDGRS